MRAVRNFAAMLMVLAGVLHAVYCFRAPADPNAVPMLVFGVIYFITGILLALNLRFSALMGMIFPLAGMGAGVVAIGPGNLDVMLIFLFAIDAVVILCCTALFLKRKKQNSGKAD
jgi:hypothetical protein